jgi:hypothetical protein
MMIWMCEMQSVLLFIALLPTLSLLLRIMLDIKEVIGCALNNKYVKIVVIILFVSFDIYIWYLVYLKYFV